MLGYWTNRELRGNFRNYVHVYIPEIRMGQLEFAEAGFKMPIS